MMRKSLKSLVLPERFELSTSPLPREVATPYLVDFIGYGLLSIVHSCRHVPSFLCGICAGWANERKIRAEHNAPRGLGRSGRLNSHGTLQKLAKGIQHV